MNKKIGFFLRNAAKMAVQDCVLPIAYALARLRHRGEKTLYVFADAHHTRLPFSLEAMYDHVQAKGLPTACHFYDYTHEGALRSLLHAIAFMDLRARARCIFICDTFLPVSSGRPDPETKVVQLCHFSGPFKKIGYVTADDVPAYYKGNVYANYDLVTASAPMYVPLLEAAMRQQPGAVQPLGVSRSDVYFRPQWVAQCRQEFYRRHPHAEGKRVLLWCPTFRGRASAPEALDNGPLLRLQERLGPDWLVLIKHHPHDDAVAAHPRCRSNCDIPTEQLLPVVDLLITDYSTVVLDYLAFDKPFLLYAPDLEEYEAKRGFFVDYRSITEHLVTDPALLPPAVERVWELWRSGDRSANRALRERFASGCDGNATERIFDYLHKTEADQ